MWTFVVTIQKDVRWNPELWIESHYWMAQKDFQWHDMKDIFKQILERIEDEEDDGNVIVDVLNITQVL